MNRNKKWRQTKHKSWFNNRNKRGKNLVSNKDVTALVKRTFQFRIKDMKRGSNQVLPYERLYLILTCICNTFKSHKLDFKKNLHVFGKYVYKLIRMLQTFIKGISKSITNLNNLNLLKGVSDTFFSFITSNVSVLEVEAQSSKALNVKFKSFLEKNKEYNNFLDLSKTFKIQININKDTDKSFNLIIFSLCVKLYELESDLQWLNWILFRSAVDTKPYRFLNDKVLRNFLEHCQHWGYASWHAKRFKKKTPKNIVKSIKVKLKKKWRFWREFKQYLLFDKAHVLIKFKWLHNNKRLLSHQYLASYSSRLQSKLKLIYKKKRGRARLYRYLFNFEYRLDILAMRIFNIKAVRWVWLLLYFGYLTVNLNKKKKNYVLQVGDLIFGWFLLKNFKFLQELSIKLYRPKTVYNFLEYEEIINTFICLNLPLKYMVGFSKSDRLVSIKFVRYTYLNTY